MFKPIPGNSEYLVSLAQEFRDVNGYPVNIEYNADHKVSLEIYGETVDVCPSWVALIAHYEFYFDDPSVKKLFNVIFAAANIKFFKYAAGKLPVFKRPVEFTHEGKRFRVVPTHPRYAVTADGELVEVVNRRQVKISYNRVKKNVILTSYPYVFVYDPDKTLYRYVYVHRLVAAAWVKHPNNDFVGFPLVNHKDSDKNNFRAYNLEWCSFQQNSLHCYESGVRTDNIKCLVRDFKTGDVKEFNSKSQAADYMGVFKSVLNDANKFLRQGKLHKGRYEFKRKDDNTPWYYENRKEKVKLGRYVITVTDKGGVSKHFHDLRDFKSAYGVWNITNAKDLVSKARYKFPDLRFDLFDSYPSGIIQGLCVETGEIVECATIAGMSVKTNIAEHLIRRCIRGKETWAYNGYAFRYKSNEPWAKGIEHIAISKSKPVTAVNTQTGERLLFDSIRAASRGMGVDDRYWLRNCLEQGVEYKGWIFEYEKVA